MSYLSAGAEDLQSISGSPPDLIEPPTGCKFHLRCRFATIDCAEQVPPNEAQPDTPAHIVSCFHSITVGEQRNAERSLDD